eukprot:g2198.t1
MRPANSSNDTRVSHVPYDRLFRTAFWEGSAGFSRPVKLAGAFSSKQWAAAALAELLPGDHLQLDVRIDPTQPRGSFAERIRMYQRHEVGQVNQVLFTGVNNQEIRRIFRAIGESKVAAMFEESRYGGLLPSWAGLKRSWGGNSSRSGSGGGSGGGCSGVSWHSHLIESPTTFQLAGKKHWRMIAPKWTPLMRPDPSFTGAVLFAQKSRYSYVGEATDPDRHIPHVRSGEEDKGKDKGKGRDKGQDKGKDWPISRPRRWT